MVFHWDNIGFDGPVIAAPRAYEIPDNTVVTSYNGSQVQNLGYQLLDGTTGKAAGIYNLSTKINSLTFQNVNTSGITSATLTMNAFFNAGVHTANTNWGISYRFNGGTWRNRNLTAGDLAAINAIAGGPLGQLSLSIDVQTTDLVSGNNTLELLPLNAPMDYPPVVANIDLLLGTSGSVPERPRQHLFTHPCTHGGIFGKPDQHDVRQSLDHDLVLDQRNLVHRRGRLDGGEGAQRHPGGIAAKHYDLHADLHRERRHVASGQYDGIGECQPDAGQRRMRIGERHDGIVCAFDQPLHRRHGVVRGGLGPVDMELRRLQRRRQRELLCVGGICIRRRGIYAEPPPGPVAGNCGLQLGGAVTFCDTFDTKNPGIPSRTGDLDPNVWGVSRATGNVNFGQGKYNGWAATTQLQTCNGTKTVGPPNDIMICNGQLRQASNDNPTGVYEAGG